MSKSNIIKQQFTGYMSIFELTYYPPFIYDTPWIKARVNRTPNPGERVHADDVEVEITITTKIIKPKRKH